MIWVFIACSALFDNGLIEQTCEDIGTCDTAIVVDSALVDDSGAHDGVDTADTGDQNVIFVPNRYHARFFVHIADGDIVPHPDWLTRFEVYAFDQAEGTAFDAEKSCILSLTSSDWTNVVVLSGAYAGYKPVDEQWSYSGRCDEMAPDSLADLQQTFEQYSLLLAFAPLTPEIRARVEMMADAVPTLHLGAFYLKIVDGPNDLLISPGAVFGWAMDEAMGPNYLQMLNLENIASVPNGFHETIALTHHALP